MRRAALVTFVLFALAAVPALAQSPRHYPRGGGGSSQDFPFGFAFRVGLYEPDGESNFWDDSFDVFTGNISDFEDTSYGFDLRYAVARNVDVVATVGAFEGDAIRAYRDPFVSDLSHRAELDVNPFTVGIQAYIGSRDRTFRPFVGAGGGFYWWRYREVGDFYDFDFEEVVTTRFESDGTTLGFYLQAGLEVALSPNWALLAEGRWHYAEDEISDDFSGFGDIDLGGREVSLGLSWRF